MDYTESTLAYIDATCIAMERNRIEAVCQSPSTDVHLIRHCELNQMRKLKDQTHGKHRKKNSPIFFRNAMRQRMRTKVCISIMTHIIRLADFQLLESIMCKRK